MGGMHRLVTLPIHGPIGLQEQLMVLMHVCAKNRAGLHTVMSP
jgi:hypothetical protein